MIVEPTKILKCIWGKETFLKGNFVLKIITQEMHVFYKIIQMRILYKLIRTGPHTL